MLEKEEKGQNKFVFRYYYDFFSFYRTMNMSHRRLNQLAILCTAMMIRLFLLIENNCMQYVREKREAIKSRETELSLGCFRLLWWHCALATGLWRISMLENLVLNSHRFNFKGMRCFWASSLASGKNYEKYHAFLFSSLNYPSTFSCSLPYGHQRQKKGTVTS